MMIRIPNASPIALFTNFETNCTCYFHPNVLIYTLRNRIAYLARNHKIFNFSPFNQNYQHLSNKNYTHNNFNNINTNFNKFKYSFNDIDIDFNETTTCTVGSDGNNLSENLKNEVYQILYSLLSCIDYIKPQSTCTILLSLIKLRFFDEELIKIFIENFKFDEANPKSISLFFLSCSKLYINKNILKNIINFILNTINTNSNSIADSVYPNTNTNPNPQPNLEYSKKDIICILGSLNRIINTNDFKLKSCILILYNKLLEKLSNYLKDCNIIELTEVLESLHTMNSNEYYTNVIDHIMNNSSLITFNNIYKIFKIINTKSRLKLNKHSLNNQLLIHYLDKLHINELIMIINDFNIYTTDDFVIQFSNQLLNTLYVNSTKAMNIPSNLGTLNQDSLNKNLKNLNTTNTLNTLNQDNLNKNRKNWENVNIFEIIKYYNRRYETSISREYYLINKILKGIKPEYDIKKVNEISNLCGYIYEILQGDNYNIKRCIINKYIIKYNYQSFFQ
ncbi:uncharacterized protein TA09130 [Theileria annulata]|uniref:Uncharacterized protein n=1 Tax=Theileria annulata TaxID=5874 RepID=Q4U9A1_THEAN|nr:uncharacterized protein TA09130 [Theileria annulata]CAI76602.1 hypothetical protein TA09130 [Theileria annulata]|eukprot:XP_953227.1 hypothetical protein TA09130 [Theileria annulata]